MEFSHTSVLLNETIENLKIKPDGIYVDGTLGGAGHSSGGLKLELNENSNYDDMDARNQWKRKDTGDDHGIFTYISITE